MPDGPNRPPEEAVWQMRLVPPECAQQRLDMFAAEHAQVTRSRMGQLIEQGCVRVDGQAVTKAGQKLRAGAEVAWHVPPPKTSLLTPEDVALPILYEDADVAVVCKPHGMVVHPSAGHSQGTLVHALLYHLTDLSGIGGEARPGIVHRLDKDTSGLLLVAKHDAAHQALSAQLKARTMQKNYVAVVQGGFSQDVGEINAPIARDPKDRKRMAVVPGGRDALTRYRVAGRWRGAAILCVRLVTGRTHQIRVHLRSIGHPLLGDPIYGGKQQQACSRLMLHAYRLSFDQPITGERITVTAPWPDDFIKNLERLGPCADTGENALQILNAMDEVCESF